MSSTSGPSRLSTRRFAVGAATLFLVFGAAACSDDDPDDASSGDGAAETDDGGSEASDAGIVAADFSLTSVTVAPGAEVDVANEGEAPHTVTADDDAFDSGEIDGGGSGSFTAPSEAGEYPFHCEIHPDMTGTLTVEG